MSVMIPQVQGTTYALDLLCVRTRLISLQGAALPHLPSLSANGDTHLSSRVTDASRASVSRECRSLSDTVHARSYASVNAPTHALHRALPAQHNASTMRQYGSIPLRYWAW